MSEPTAPDARKAALIDARRQVLVSCVLAGAGVALALVDLVQLLEASRPPAVAILAVNTPANGPRD